jgi:hypothetical protein
MLAHPSTFQKTTRNELFPLWRGGGGRAHACDQPACAEFRETASDWLPKLLVGATLTQLGRIPSALGPVSARVSSAIGDEASATVFARPC